MSLNAALGQYMTPAYAARQLWADIFSDVGPQDQVVEPTCGDGRMLAAIPPEVPAIGYEIDARLARQAEARTGRRVVVGDFLTSELPARITVAFGNPPFQAAFVDRMLERLYPLMPDGGRAGFIAPAYFFQTPSRVLRWNREWTISADILPRTLWPKLQRPLFFAVFTRDPQPVLRGLRLYAECEMANTAQRDTNRELVEGGSWVACVRRALEALGGKAHVQALYSRMVGNRPTATEHWREKIRQSLQRGPFTSLGDGVWEIQT